MDDKKMDVLLVKPKMFPQRVQIGTELEDLQQAVGGIIETISPYSLPAVILANENGKLMNLSPNRILHGEGGEFLDLIAGDFLVVGVNGSKLTSLSPELMQHFEKVFHRPQMFALLGDNVMALPLPDNQVIRPETAEKPPKQKHPPERDSR